MKRGEAVGHYAPLMKNNACSIMTLGEGGWRGIRGWGGVGWGWKRYVMLGC